MNAALQLTPEELRDPVLAEMAQHGPVLVLISNVPHVVPWSPMADAEDGELPPMGWPASALEDA